ncbi:MAG: S9 family peptidase [bacterium]|nr:S9 family peptidase [bacterium]
MSIHCVNLEDTLNYVSISDVHASPDGNCVLYRTHCPIADKNTYEHQTILRTPETTYILEETILGSPIWTDIDTFFASVSTDTHAVVLTKYTGNAHESIGEIPYPLHLVEVLDENRFLLLGDVDLRFKHALERGMEKEDAAFQIAQENEDCIIAEEFPFWSDGVGITNGHRNLLFLFDRRSGLQALTEEWFSTEQAVYDQKTDTVYYTGYSYMVQKPLQLGLYKRPLKELYEGYERGQAEGKNLLENQGYQISNIGVCEGKLVLLGRKNQEEKTGIFLLDIQTEQIENLITFEIDPGTSVFTDVAYGNTRQWQVRDGKIYFTGTWEETSELYSVELSGQMKKLTSLGGIVHGFSVSNRGIYLVAMKGLEHQELYWLAKEELSEESPAAPEAITDYNRSFYEKKTLSIPEPYTWTDKYGFLIAGYVLHPVNQKPGVRYPAILNIHGGPRGAYGAVYFHEMQYWAANGYFVLFCNPTGSTGRGNAFKKIIGGCGGSDYEDIMGFVDFVLERIPEIDPARLGVTGGSYGGFMTNWILGHSNRFAAAVSQRSTANNITEAANKDIAPGFIRSMTEPDAQDKYEKLWEGSPLRFIDKNTHTPTLFLHSLQDYRCYHVEALQMYAAFQYLHIPTRMVLFKNESHSLSRNGHPRNRIRRLREITEWMDRYLKQ